MRLFSSDRLCILAGLLLLLLPTGALVADVAAPEVPSFVGETIYSPNRATVASVVPSQSADIILLDGGLEQGLRRGMVCTVDRGIRSIGELIIIESRIDRSAGLILDLAPGLSIQTGDIARIKTIQIN